jgi:hypothetical protein
LRPIAAILLPTTTIEKLAMDAVEPVQTVALTDSFPQLANDVLVWIGFGTVVGLLAKGIMPGRVPGGAIATVVL